MKSLNNGPSLPSFALSAPRTPFDLSPFCAPKRTSAKRFKYLNRTLRDHCSPGIPRLVNDSRCQFEVINPPQSRHARQCFPGAPTRFERVTVAYRALLLPPTRGRAVLIWCPEGALGEHPHNGIPVIFLPGEALRLLAGEDTDAIECSSAGGGGSIRRSSK
jgi:hypothetical protein